MAWYRKGKANVHDLSQHHFVYPQSHMDWLRIEPGHTWLTSWKHDIIKNLPFIVRLMNRDKVDWSNAKDCKVLMVIFIHQFWNTLLLTLTYRFFMVSYCRIFMTLQWRAVFLVKPIMKTRQCMWYPHLRHVRMSPLHVRRQNYWNLLMVETYVPFTLNYVGNVR